MKNQLLHTSLIGLSTIKYIVVLFSLLSFNVIAGPGHDHGDAPSQAMGMQSPRLVSQSDLFELVAVADKSQLVIYLDRFATNEPVITAKIEVETRAGKGMAKLQSDGTYLFESDIFAKPGSIAMGFTIIDGKDTDLLAGDLVLPEPHANHNHGINLLSHPWFKWTAYTVGGFAVLAALVIAWCNRRKRASFHLFLVTFTLGVAALTSPEVQAGPGHDHGDEAAPAGNSNSPKRQNDGSVFLPKTSQRLLLIRTESVLESNLPKTLELSGRVIVDPNAGGKVQPTQAGRVESGPQGLPLLGQSVKKGQLLAMIRSSASAIERANQTATGFEVQSNLDLARKRLARLEQLEGTVPQKDIETARAELQSLTRRSKVIGASAVALETLLAPVSGVVAAVNVVAGQVVDAREVMFEIVDPTRLMFEANAFDASLLGNISSASVNVGTSSAALTYVGAGRSLREGAIPLIFRSSGTNALPLAVNQSVKIIVQTHEIVKGFAIPNAAVVKNTSNQDIVWVHTNAEIFIAHVVRFTQLDGSRLTVMDGLAAGDRVVTQGASLVNQVR